jgi:translation initiation factor 2 beta subunit (eIF-2beta)/eIF-5
MGEDFFRERKRALCLPCRERGASMPVISVERGI